MQEADKGVDKHLVKVIGRYQWLTDLLAGAMITLAILGLIIVPKETSEAARAGVYLCLDVIIPSLFPFFVLSTLVIELGLVRYIGRALEGIMRPLFRLSGSCSVAVVLGFLGGYSVGAKCTISLYEKKLCSKAEAERLLAFCNNSGPAFILGAVGAGIMGNSRAGWMLYLAHTAASITIGLLFRFYKYKSPPTPVDTRRESTVVSLSEAFTGSVRSSFSSVFYISSFVIFFTVIIRLLYVTGIIPALSGFISGALEGFGVTQSAVQNLLTGLIEITSGLWNLQGSPSLRLVGQIAMAAFMLGWAGLSVHCQVLSFIGRSGLSSWTYFIGKILHGFLSAGYVYLFARFLDFEDTVPSAIAEQVQVLARLNFWDSLSITLYVVTIIGMSFLLFCACIMLKRHNRPRR